MEQKIYIFNFFFIIFLFVSNFSFAKSIDGTGIVIDGDTIKIGNKYIRLHGIDAPELNQTCLFENKSWDCGKESESFLLELINLKKIKCDITEKDKYGRFVAICYLDHLNINNHIVEKGWAIAYRFYSLDYIEAEEIAKKNKHGIWKGHFIEPYLFRKKRKN